MTASATTPVSGGVEWPYVGVKSAKRPSAELSVSFRCPALACHVPENDTTAACSVPSAAIPRLVRPELGWFSSTPPCMRMLLGMPLVLTKSPSTPTVVAPAWRLCSMCVSFSAPPSRPAASTGASE